MKKIFALFGLIIGSFCLLPSSAQDLEPRLLSPVPTGGNFAIASYGYSSGNILLDNSLPIEDLNARMNNFVAAYARSFKLFNKLAKFDVVLPYSSAIFEGVVSNVDSSTSRNGFGDPLVRISMVLVGSGPLTTTDFLQHEQKKFNLGAFIRVRPPIGQYDPTKLINLGANRWATNIGMAASYTFQKKLILEAHLRSWFFTENREFFNGNTIRQKPLISGQMHVAYIFKPGLWAAISFGKSSLGETIVNGIEKDDLRDGYRYGAAIAYRFTRQSALKIGLTSGLATRYGADFTTAMLAYQFNWFDKAQ